MNARFTNQINPIYVGASGSVVIGEITETFDTGDVGVLGSGNGGNMGRLQLYHNAGYVTPVPIPASSATLHYNTSPPLGSSPLGVSVFVSGVGFFCVVGTCW